MLLYRDVISQDEIITDAFTLVDIDDIAYEVDCKMMTIKEGADVDIGANASAEEADEELADGMVQVNNVVYSMRLVETQFDKKSFVTYIKSYMKAIKKHLEETNPARVPVFETKIQGVVKKIVASFADYQFFVGESMNPEGAVMLLNYRDDGVTPFFTFFKDSVREEKL